MRLFWFVTLGIAWVLGSMLALLSGDFHSLIAYFVFGLLFMAIRAKSIGSRSRGNVVRTSRPGCVLSGGQWVQVVASADPRPSPTGLRIGRLGHDRR